MLCVCTSGPPLQCSYLYSPLLPMWPWETLSLLQRCEAMTFAVHLSDCCNFFASCDRPCLELQNAYLSFYIDCFSEVMASQSSLIANFILSALCTDW